MQTKQHVFIASDHAGLSLKTAILHELHDVTLEDLGTHTTDSCDYPTFAHTLSRKVLETGHYGILVCGTGMGMSITANRYKGIRAALCTHEFHAQACREHNNANVLCLGARVTGTGLALEIVRLFLTTPFAGDRHQRRIDLIEQY